MSLLAMALLLCACAVPGPVTPPERTEAEELLLLIGRVIQASSAEQRRGIEAGEQARHDRAPTAHNMLRLAMVRAFSAALPAQLMQARSDLQALADGAHELTAPQRHLALMTLIMVDQRLQMGAQITQLQQQIDSLTEIEASLKDNDARSLVEPPR